MSDRPAKHAAARLSTYLDVHRNRMAQFRASEFVGDDTITLDKVPADPRQLLLEGEIACRGKIVIAMLKRMEYLGEPGPDTEVQTFEYSYNVSVRGVGNVFRYDNQHPIRLHNGHQDPHHKHTFDWMNNNELDGSPEWIGADRWPTLSDVIEEAMAWHAANQGNLPHPNDFPDDLQQIVRA